MRGVSGDDPDGGAGSGVPRRRREAAAPGGPGSRPPSLRGLAPTHRWRLRCPTAGDGSMGPRPKIATVERREGSRSHRDRSAPRKRGRRASQARQNERVRLSALHPPLIRGRAGRCRHGDGLKPAAASVNRAEMRRHAKGQKRKREKARQGPGTQTCAAGTRGARGRSREAGCLTS
jgi:hypothetical protein